MDELTWCQAFSGIDYRTETDKKEWKACCQYKIGSQVERGLAGAILEMTLACPGSRSTR